MSVSVTIADHKANATFRMNQMFFNIIKQTRVVMPQEDAKQHQYFIDTFAGPLGKLLEEFVTSLPSSTSEYYFIAFYCAKNYSLVPVISALELESLHAGMKSSYPPFVKKYLDGFTSPRVSEP